MNTTQQPLDSSLFLNRYALHLGVRVPIAGEQAHLVEKPNGETSRSTLNAGFKGTRQESILWLRLFILRFNLLR